MSRTTIDHRESDGLDFDLSGFHAVTDHIRKHLPKREGAVEQQAIDFAAARAARDEGIQRSANKAARAAETWPEDAYNFLCRYARTHERFISEELTACADRMGYGAPTSSKAWGAIFQRASREGIIRRDGYGVSLRRHCSPSPMWHSMVYVGGAA